MITIDTAKKWLTESLQNGHGPRINWEQETIEQYHRDFGLLVDFIIDNTDTQDKAQPEPKPCASLAGTFDIETIEQAFFNYDDDGSASHCQKFGKRHSEWPTFRKYLVEHPKQEIPEAPQPCNYPCDLLPPKDIFDAASYVDSWMERNGYRKWQLGKICSRNHADMLEQVTKERDELAQWKRSAIEEDKEWSLQEIGLLLNLPMGSKIRKNIAPGIRKLILERDEARSKIQNPEDLRKVIAPIQEAQTMLEDNHPNWDEMGKQFAIANACIYLRKAHAAISAIYGKLIGIEGKEQI